ncbi:cell wall-associated hydrolase (NlpC/P60 family) protein [Salinisphaera sp. PC39]|uniref:C40 family peptidase n=1 Tax=Salinisphaera sp. PC39 TaxID=1304156 RepID=UPI00334085BE
MRRPVPFLAALLAAALLTACAGMSLPGAGEPAPTEARGAVIAAASAQIGAPYRYGGADRKGFDDAGFVHFAFEEAGFDLPRDREAQLRAGRPIRFAEARPGDLLFHRVERTRNGRERAILHVGLYIGDGSMLHASLDRDEVALETVDNAYWFQRRVAVIQVLP